MPVGIAEVQVPALDYRRPMPLDRSAPITLPCGSGPTINVDARPVATSVSGTVGALIDALPMPFRVCGNSTFALGPGRHRIEESVPATGDAPGTASSATEVAALTLAPVPALRPAGAPRRVAVRRWDDEHRHLLLGGGATSFLALSENANAGWVAHLNGHRLAPVRLDGWRQGWLVPAGRGGPVTIDYAPARPFQLILWLGLALVLVLVGLAAWPRGKKGSAANGEPGAVTGRTIPIGDPIALPAWAAAGITVAAALALGGWWLGVTGAALAGILLIRHAAGGRLLPWLAAASAAAGGLVVFLDPGRATIDHAGSFSTWAQLGAVVALVAVAASLVDRVGPRASS